MSRGRTHDRPWHCQTGDRQAPEVRLQLLGEWALSGARVDVRLPVSCRRLLAYLALRGPADREAVAGVLWPDVREQRAHGNLRTALWRLRAAHSGVVAATDGSLRVGHRVSVDVDRLLLDLQRVERRPLDDDLRLAPVHLRRGELLPGWYDDWVLLERERIRQLRLHGLEELARALADEGRHGAALDAAHAAVQLEPLRESGHRVVLAIHLGEGNISEALRQYRSYERLLRQELGVEPSPALRALVAAAAR